MPTTATMTGTVSITGTYRTVGSLIVRVRVPVGLWVLPERAKKLGFSEVRPWSSRHAKTCQSGTWTDMALCHSRDRSGIDAGRVRLGRLFQPRVRRRQHL
ncbi:hypothetical protein DF3PB_5510004 [uncultured Defluviicoccus sp.]|uniref:Uncharacterized protein n=1 Tax=metagenome TaxID=256318 RepID=A0A380THT3_9ZZZZ|nr:hypothetical protein DF3PB_5510004 [uncultured Defluviicoccus sp.]